MKSLQRSRKPDNIFTPLLADQYQDANHESREAVKFAKNLTLRNFVFQMNSNTTTKTIFQKVAILCGKTPKSAPIILKTENTIIPPTEIPEALARYFYDTSGIHNFPSHVPSQFFSESIVTSHCTMGICRDEIKKINFVIALFQIIGFNTKG